MAPYSLITSPESLLELFAGASEKGVSSVGVRSVTELAAQDEQSYPRDCQGLVYHIDSLEAVKAGLDDEVCHMVTYWWGRYRDAMADTLKRDGHRVIQPEEVELPPAESNRYFPIRGSDLGYKLEKSKEINQSGFHAFRLSAPRDFQGFHPNLMPERIDNIDRPVGVTNITFAPFLKHRGTFFDVMSTLSMRERAAYLLDICLAVNALHESGYVHTDLKPENIHFDLSESQLPKVYVADLEGAWMAGDDPRFNMSLSYNPTGYYRDGWENMLYVSHLDTFSLAHIILEGLCGELKYESLIVGMLDETYGIKDGDEVLMFLDQFFSQVTDEKGGAIPDRVKTVLKNTLRWRKGEIPMVGNLCIELSHGYEIDVRRNKDSKPVAIHDSDQKSQTR